MCKIRPRAVVSLLVLGVLVAAGVQSVAAQPFSNTLTAEQVACNESQLQQLLQRLTLTRGTSGNHNRSLTLLLTYSNAFGFYEGLAVFNQTPLRANGTVNATEAEQFFAFYINPSIRQLLLNPARPTLAQVSLAREISSSNLVTAGAATAMTLTLNPTLAAQGGAGNLVINNFQAANGQACGGLLAVDVKPGRGLIDAGLVTPCHTALTDFDRMVFSILERTVRVQATGSALVDTKIAIYRGEQPFTYRIDVYPLSASGQLTGKIALQLTINVDAQGRITDGQLTILPPCVGIERSGCSNADTGLEVFLLPPVFGGVEARPVSAPSFSVVYQFGATPAPVVVDWTRLLSGTTWNQGF
jgi:hypothetical protein